MGGGSPTRGPIGMVMVLVMVVVLVGVIVLPMDMSHPLILTNGTQMTKADAPNPVHHLGAHPALQPDADANADWRDQTQDQRSRQIRHGQLP